MNNPMQSQMQQPTMITVVLLNDMNMINNYPVNPGTSIMFLNEKMTEFRMRSKDMNGFPLPDRIWKMEEVIPPQQQNNYATKDDLNSMQNDISEMKKMLMEFMK